MGDVTILKFGGTSVADAAAFTRVVTIVRRHGGPRPVVVVSALAGMTDALFAGAAAGAEGDVARAGRIVADQLDRHAGVGRSLLSGDAAVSFHDQLAQDFGSLERWRVEFTAMGKALGGGSGWVLLVWSDRGNRLVNQWAADHTHALAGATPILALDMYEHSYHIDYGAKAAAYVDAFMENIHWQRVAQTYEKCLS